MPVPEHHVGLFRVEQVTRPGKVDFVGDLISWKQISPAPGEGGLILMLHVEVSWPVALPYERRQKQTYSYESFVTE